MFKFLRVLNHISFVLLEVHIEHIEHLPTTTPRVVPYSVLICSAVLCTSISVSPSPSHASTTSNHTRMFVHSSIFSWVVYTVHASIHCKPYTNFPLIAHSIIPTLSTIIQSSVIYALRPHYSITPSTSTLSFQHPLRPSPLIVCPISLSTYLTLSTYPPHSYSVIILTRHNDEALCQAPLGWYRFHHHHHRCCCWFRRLFHCLPR